MGIERIVVLFPGDDPLADEFVVTVQAGGIFQISGPDEMVQMTDATHFRLNSPLVTENGDGTYTAFSG